MKAKDREEFVKVWKEEFGRIRLLAHSLPTDHGIALNFLNEVKELERYIEIGVKETYGEYKEASKK